MAKTISNVITGVGLISIKYPVGGSYVEAGYTDDGVSVEYTEEGNDIRVEEESFAIDRVIQKEAVAITLNMAESSLYNMDKALAGSVLAGSVITIGGGLIKKMGIKVVAKNPAGFARTIEATNCVATGKVGLKYSKGKNTIVPVTFEVLKPATGDPFTITDATS